MENALLIDLVVYNKLAKVEDVFDEWALSQY